MLAITSPHNAPTQFGLSKSSITATLGPGIFRASFQNSNILSRVSSEEALEALMRAVTAYPTIASNSGKIHLIEEFAKPTFLGLTFSTSIAFETVGVDNLSSFSNWSAVGTSEILDDTYQDGLDDV